LKSSFRDYFKSSYENEKFQVYEAVEGQRKLAKKSLFLKKKKFKKLALSEKKLKKNLKAFKSS
jgi:hypothetical protein